MNIDDRFNTTGYVIVATAHAVNGGGPPDTEECVVMHNESSHYLVAHREDGNHHATLLASFRYAPPPRPLDAEEDDEAPVAEAYGAALDVMVKFAKAH